VALKGEEKSKYHRDIYKIANNIAVVAFGFALLVSAMMIINYFRLQTTDPVDSKAIQALTERLKDNPDDQALRDEIRALQLLTRKAFFTAQWQINTGAYILVGIIAVFGVSLWVMHLISKKNPYPKGTEAVDAYWRSKATSRLALGIGGGLLLAGSVIFLVGTRASVGDGDLLEVIGTRPNQLDETEKEQPASTAVRRQTFSPLQWPGFRGPGGNGIAVTSSAPTEWDGSTGRNILWKTALEKPGNNSPVVWGDRIFVSGADRQSEVVYCVDRHSGRILWTQEVAGSESSREMPTDISADTGLAAPTMAANGRHVFAIFATGNIVGLDLDGNTLWARNLGVPVNHYGHASSLIIYQNLLLVLYDQETEAFLYALDVEDGKELWRTRRAVMTSWTSPILVDTGGHIELVTSANPYVASYDPENGRELWKVDIMMGEVGPSPAFSRGYVLAANTTATLAAIDVRTHEIVWEIFDDLPSASSPLATAKHVFIAADYGVVTCIDLLTGEIQWVHEFDQGFYSSPILVGDLVYLMDRSGGMHIFRDAGTFELLAEPSLGEKCTTTPAFVDARIYIRGTRHLFAIGEVVEPSAEVGKN